MKRRQSFFLVAAIVGLIIFAVYLPALRNGFVNWDDNVYVQDNTIIRSLGPAFFTRAFFGFYEANWIPLTWASHAVDYALWGLNPAGHHLSNIVLHAANSFLVVLLMAGLLEAAGAAGSIRPSSLFRERRAILLTAGASGLLFGLHPVHVESVAWVSERKDLLCALFFLLSIILYSKHVMTIGPAISHAQGKRRLLGAWYFLSLGCFVLALLSKPMAVTLPAVLVLLDWHPFHRIASWRSLWASCIEKAPYLVFSIFASVLTVLAQRAGGGIGADQPPVVIRTLAAVKALAAYLYHLILPVDLLPYYPYEKELSSYLTVGQGLAVAVVAVIVMLSIRADKRDRAFPAAWAYYGITLFPVLGIVVQVGGQSMADRYTYLPSLGPMLLMGLAATWGWSKTGGMVHVPSVATAGIAGVAIVICCTLAFLTTRQISVWKNSVDLWSYVISKEPERVPLAYNNRGLAYKEQGQLDRALEDFTKAIDLDPSFANAYTSRGWTFREKGRIEQALADYSRAIALDPKHAIALNDRGMLYQETGYVDQAIDDFTGAVSLNPAFAEAYTNRGLALEQTGRMDQALEDYSAALEANPYFVNAYNNRGLLLERMGRLDEALRDLSEAIRLNPSSVEARSNRGLVFEDMGRFDRAIEDYDRAIEIKPDDHLLYRSRGIALARSGRCDKAVDDFSNAIGLKPDAARAYAERGDCHRTLGNVARADADYRQACLLGERTACDALRSSR